MESGRCGRVRRFEDAKLFLGLPGRVCGVPFDPGGLRLFLRVAVFRLVDSTSKEAPLLRYFALAEMLPWARELFSTLFSLAFYFF